MPAALTTGLTLTLGIDQTDYIRVPAQTRVLGARMSITPFGRLFNVEDDGIDVLPGQSTSIVLREVSVYASTMTNFYSPRTEKKRS
jgi:hypothetical protein